MHLSIPTIALALATALVLSACNRQAESVPPTPAVVVTGTPGPAGPAGETGAPGKTGAAGKAGADATVIVVQPSASAPGN